MADKISKDRLALFERLIKAFSIALTNSTLYPPEHPSSIAVMASLKKDLDEFLNSEERVEIGIAPDNIMLNGAFVEEGGDLFRAVADHLHKKGVVAMLFARGVGTGELAKLFSALREHKGDRHGIASRIGVQPHLVVKEVDYSAMLTSGKTSSAMKEEALWKSLSDLGEGLRKGQLPASKVEFMTEFLKDPRKASDVLNAIYKDAVSKLEGESAAAQIREVFSRINGYFESGDPGGRDRTKRELAEIMARLDPNFVVSLLSEGPSGGRSCDLAEEVFKDLPDDEIADFVYSVMRKGGGVSDKIVRVFSRLVPGKRASSVLPMVAEKLFSGKMIGRGILSALQDSIKELFETDPADAFVAELYDLTVKSFLDKDKGAGGLSGKYSAIVGEYLESLKPDAQRAQRIRLMLNILWLENDPMRFRKVCALLADALREMPSSGYAKTVKEVFELLTDRLGEDRLHNSVVARAVQGALGRLDTPETADRLISLIPGSDRDRLDDIAYVLTRLKAPQSGKLLDLFAGADDGAGRPEYGRVLSRFDERIADEIISRMESSIGRKDAGAVKALYGVLKEVAFKRSHPVAGRLVKEGSSQVRSWILDEYCPATAEEKAYVFEAIRKEKNTAIKHKLLITLVKTKDADMIGKLFGLFGGGLFVSRHLVDLVTLCGTFKVPGAIPFLKETLERRRFPYVGAARRVRAQSVLSLARIGRPEGTECVIRAENDPDPSVRAMCTIALGGTGARARKAK